MILLLLVPLFCGALRADPPHLFGVNLAGAEFGSGTELHYGTDYIYPDASDLDYYHSKGLKLVRLPFKWERVQKALNGPLDAAELSRIDTVLDQAAARGMWVIPDMHNYAGRIVPGLDSDPLKEGVQGFKIGASELPVSAYKDVWKKLASHFQGRNNIWAYGLMNEPTGISTHDWFTAAQAAVDGVREVDMESYVLLPGTYYSNAHRWNTHGAYLIDIEDAADKRIFEAHSYWDGGHDGEYERSFASTGQSVNVGVNDLVAFVEWCVANEVQGFVGEFGVPWDHPDWAPVLENAMDYMQANGISGTYWAAGPWWGDDYELTLDIDTRNNAPRYPLAILQRYGDGDLRPYARDFRWYRDAIARGLLYSFAYEYGGNGASIAVEEKASDTAAGGSRSFKVTYTLPSDSNANCGMHIEGGVHLQDHFTMPGSVLSLWVRGDAGTRFRLRLVDVEGNLGPSISLTDHGPDPSAAWRKYEIPMTAFVDSVMPGTAPIERIQFDMDTMDGVARTFYIDEVKIDAPTYDPFGEGSETLLVDDFEDDDLEGWGTGGGGWSVSLGEAEVEDASNALAWRHTLSAQEWTEYVFGVDVRTTGMASHGLAFLVRDAENHYRCVFDPGVQLCRLERIEHGTSTLLAEEAYDVGGGGAARIEVDLRAGDFVIRRNGTVVLRHGDARFTEGSVGMFADGTGSVFFDNVEVSGRSSPSTTVWLGDVNYGVGARDAATGSGYILWSDENVFDRLDPGPNSKNSSNLIAVVWDGEGWLVDNNTQLTPFTPKATDVLLAQVDFTHDTITSYEGTNDSLHGIARGYVSGDLNFHANLWGGDVNAGEFTVSGTTFTKHDFAADSGYDTWVGATFPGTTPVADTALDAVPNPSGIRNRYSYVYGLNPLNPDPDGLPYCVRVEDGIALIYRQRVGVGDVGTLVETAGTPGEEGWGEEPLSPVVEASDPDGTGEVRLLKVIRRFGPDEERVFLRLRHPTLP